MSYNTRSNMTRGGYGRGHAAVGQRRPVPPANNFVSSGQLVPQKKPLIQMPVKQQQHQQQCAPQQQNQQQNRNHPPQQQQKPPVQAQPQQQPPPLLQQQPAQPQQQPAQPPQSQPPAVPLKIEDPNTSQNFFTPDVSMTEESTGQAKEKRIKPFWNRNGGGKISKKEKLRRRNQKLRKILQPKNALMVLHELLENYSYNCSETGEMNPFKETVFKASVVVDGIEHFGSGKSKIAAKTAAAEEAIKYLVFKKLKSSEQTVGTIANKMITDDEEGTLVIDESANTSFPWQHIACFALHKLFTSWDDNSNLSEKLSQNALEPQHHEKKPAKKLPANAESMNPIMLLNQMFPQAQYVELSRVGNPPHITFTYQCSVNDKYFTGTGPNKKSAKNLCAYAACAALLDIKYPPEVYPGESK